MSALTEDYDIPEKEKKLPPAKRERLRQDRLKIAQRYEQMKLYDEAIRYFRRAGETAEAERVQEIRRKEYSEKSREFEAKGDFQKAYDLLKIIQDADGMARLRAAHDLHDEGSEPKTAIPAPKIIGPQLWAKPNDPGDSADILAQGPARPLPKNLPPKAETIPLAKKEPAQALPVPEAFKVCPYCGKALNLPKPPKFCPYCSEKLVQ